jgi:hypothetical protein
VEAGQSRWTRPWRQHRKRGLVRLPVDLGKDELDQLEAHGYLDAQERGDRYCMAEDAERALRDFLTHLRSGGRSA